MHETSQPLVSIIVITYNSSKYVLETLESAKAQTYQNIELIVTDDASQDKTVEICQTWLEENGKCFVRTKVVTANQNTGISANCNRGLKYAQGSWIKFIAGDDILVGESINIFIDYILKSSEIPKVISSKVHIINNLSSLSQSENKILGYETSNAHIYMTSQIASNGFSIPACGVLINKLFLDSVGGFDEKYRNIEDVPLWWKCLYLGHTIHIINKVTAFYRVHTESITGNKSSYFNYEVARMHVDIFKKYRLPFLQSVDLWEGRINQVRYFLLVLSNGRFIKAINFIHKYLHVLKPNWWVYRSKKVMSELHILKNSTN